MYQRRVDLVHRSLTKAWASAGGQVLREESLHERFVNAPNSQVLLGQPVRKVSDAAQVGAGGG
jgi:hypothetical protein